MFITNGRDLPKKIAIETAINIGEVFAILWNTTVPDKYRLASEKIMVEISVIITIGAMSNEVIIEMHQVLAGKIIDPGFQGHTTYHPRTF